MILEERVQVSYSFLIPENEKLKDNKDMNEAFGQNVINSYIKLKRSEFNEFNQKENFDKTIAITRWERNNTLDC